MTADPAEMATKALAFVDPDSLREVVILSREDADAIDAVVQAATDLYELVEMEESVGICLSDRVPSLRLGDALDRLRAARERM